MKRNGIGIALAALCLGVLVAPAQAKTRIRAALAPTVVDADAKGRATLALKSASDGKFEVSVRHLDRNATYEIIVGGVHVADLVTNGGGGGKVRFRTRPRNDRDLPLGFDPRNATIVVRSATGDDVLATTFPDDPTPDDDGDVVCCIPDDSGPECEDRTPDECAAQGGTVVAGATSCLPNPCDGAPPVDPDIVCCIPDDSGAECEDRTQAECLAEGGTIVNATSCDPNPCEATPPAGGEIVCCLPDNGGDGANECEDLSADACTAAGGTVSDATSCTPDPCNGGTPPVDDEIACCVPSATDGAECETKSPDDCTALGGSPAPTASCTPDPCGGTSGGDGSSGSGGGDDSSGHG